MAILAMPTEEERRRIFEEYTVAVGKVAYAWNYLHEKLARLFVAIIMAEGTPQTGLAIWYSTENDRVQRTMLKAAIEAAPSVRWENRPTARDDLIWLMKSANDLAVNRNGAVHAPCMLMISGDGTQMSADLFSQHTQARYLSGKALLTEFDYCERKAETLSHFTMSATVALHAWNAPWPDRPSLPTRRAKKDLTAQRAQTTPEAR